MSKIRLTVAALKKSCLYRLPEALDYFKSAYHRNQKVCGIAQ